jgi:N-acylneuraminate cytidylyltransferase
MTIVALIPARAGSKRIPGKNTKLLGGKPLIQWTIDAAKESGIFAGIAASSDDYATRELVAQCGGVSSIHRPSDLATDTSADIAWVRHALDWLSQSYRPNAFAILRPTSPFRTAATIRRAYAQFKRSEVHSIRAVELAQQHPGKMWFCNGPGYPLTPVCDAKRSDGTPWHSSPTQTLPPVYVQNASLEIAWSYVLDSYGTISGKKIAPFFTEGYEGFDLNTEADWQRAEQLLADGLVTLPDLAAPVHRG